MSVLPYQSSSWDFFFRVCCFPPSPPPPPPFFFSFFLSFFLSPFFPLRKKKKKKEEEEKKGHSHDLKQPISFKRPSLRPLFSVYGLHIIHSLAVTEQECQRCGPLKPSRRTLYASITKWQNLSYIMHCSQTYLKHGYTDSVSGVTIPGGDNGKCNTR